MPLNLPQPRFSVSRGLDRKLVELQALRSFLLIRSLFATKPRQLLCQAELGFLQVAVTAAQSHRFHVHNSLWCVPAPLLSFSFLTRSSYGRASISDQPLFAADKWQARRPKRSFSRSLTPHTCVDNLVILLFWVAIANDFSSFSFCPFLPNRWARSPRNMPSKSTFGRSFDRSRLLLEQSCS